MSAAPTIRGLSLVFLIVALSPHWLAAQPYPAVAVAFPGYGRDFGDVLVPKRSLLDSVLGGRQTAAQPVSVDLAPVLDGILGVLHDHGIPLRHDRELSGEHGIVFTASFQLDPTLPPMQMHIGDSGPLDAFYADDGGFRFALAWAIPRARQLALHVGAGEDSEFGNWAIAGIQWRHPSLPLAVGLGMPVALSNADGPVGVVCQLRMLLD
jgi:hypothetical protein